MSGGGCTPGCICDDIGNCKQSTPYVRCCQYGSYCITEAQGLVFHKGEIDETTPEDSITRGILYPGAGWYVTQAARMGKHIHCEPHGLITHINGAAIFINGVVNEDAFAMLATDEIEWTIIPHGADAPTTQTIARL